MSFLFTSPIKQKCPIIGPLKLSLWAGTLKASSNFIEGAREGKKSLKEPGSRFLKALVEQNNFLKGTQIKIGIQDEIRCRMIYICHHALQLSKNLAVSQGFQITP